MNSQWQVEADGNVQSPDYGNEPELALVALISMLARYPFAPSASLADSISRHFLYVAGEERLPAHFRDTATRLYEEWRLMVAKPGSLTATTISH